LDKLRVPQVFHPLTSPAPLAATALLFCGLALGCSDDSDPAFLAANYDPCFSLNDCELTSSRCEQLSMDFAGFLYTDGICTVECGVPGARSPDCPRALVGRFGSCYPSTAAGGSQSAPVCFEPCNDTNDCALGFRCLGDLDLCAQGEPCSIELGDAICVPGPD
jgi:hypothetical protein